MCILALPSLVWVPTACCGFVCVSHAPSEDGTRAGIYRMGGRNGHVVRCPIAGLGVGWPRPPPSWPPLYFASSPVKDTTLLRAAEAAGLRPRSASPCGAFLLDRLPPLRQESEAQPVGATHTKLGRTLIIAASRQGRSGGGCRRPVDAGSHVRLHGERGQPFSDAGASMHGVPARSVGTRKGMGWAITSQGAAKNRVNAELRTRGRGGGTWRPCEPLPGVDWSARRR